MITSSFQRRYPRLVGVIHLSAPLLLSPAQKENNAMMLLRVDAIRYGLSRRLVFHAFSTFTQLSVHPDDFDNTKALRSSERTSMGEDTVCCLLLADLIRSMVAHTRPLSGTLSSYHTRSIIHNLSNIAYSATESTIRQVPAKPADSIAVPDQILECLGTSSSTQALQNS